MEQDRPSDRPRMNGHINLAVQMVIAQTNVSIKLGTLHELEALIWLQQVEDDMELWEDTRAAARAARTQLLAELEALLTMHHQRRNTSHNPPGATA